MRSDILAVNNRYRRGIDEIQPENEHQNIKFAFDAECGYISNREISSRWPCLLRRHWSPDCHACNGIGEDKRPAIADGETVDPLPPSHWLTYSPTQCIVINYIQSVWQIRLFTIHISYSVTINPNRVREQQLP